MHFALLGDHPDGLEMARALVASARHTLAVYHGPPVGAEFLRRWGLSFKTVADLEEVLADPEIEAVIVAGSIAERPGQLRRALQSERHVLCVHPSDETPEIAYEAAMIQGDTRSILLPLMPHALHPAVGRLGNLARQESVLGAFRLLDVEWASSESILIQEDPASYKLALPGWDMLRYVAGEIAEVSGFAWSEELSAGDAVLLAGSFIEGGIFRITLLPGQHESYLRLTAIGGYSRAELLFASGWPGPAQLHWQDENGTPHEETWDAWNPWPPLVEEFEEALASRNTATTSRHDIAKDKGLLSWQTAVRALELDDAARRSVQRRRVSVLEYPEATEEAGFKGTMTLVGCATLWAILVLLILSRWFPWLGWLIIPVLVLFLGVQVLRWLVPAPTSEELRGQDSTSESVSQRNELESKERT
jgi:predicted dehydrogenase